MENNESDIVLYDSSNNPKKEAAKVDGFVESKNYYVGTGYIADMLGISRDLIRNHINEFKDYFDVQYSKPGKGGHIRFPSDSIELLENIIQMRKTKSVEQVKEILDDPAASQMFKNGMSSDKQLAALLAENNKQLFEAFSRLLDQKFENQNLLIEDRNSLIRQNEQLISEIKELKEQNEKLISDQESSVSKMLSLEGKNEELLSSSQETKEMVRDMLTKMEDSSKKKGFFSFFKK